MPRIISFAEAIREATQQLMEKDPNVIVMGEGVPDPKAIFGTTKGLHEQFGKNRVFDQPLSENGCTGVLIGAAIGGLRPIMVHQRIDFMLYSMDQLVNNAAKWYSMFGGNAGSVPMVIRCIIGRGWGQGNQHSQNLAPLFASIPGLKVVMPSNAYDAKGLLVAAVKDPNPVIFIEHRWLHNTTSEVPEELYEVPIGRSKVVREGKDISLITYGYQVHEAREAAKILQYNWNISCEIIDTHTLHDYMDYNTKLPIIFIDEAWETSSVYLKEVALAFNRKAGHLANPACYVPSSPGVAKHYYITSNDIVNVVLESCGKYRHEIKMMPKPGFYDQPDPDFKGPF